MKNEVMVEVSARHIHLTQEQIEILFGKGHQLTVKKELSQPGQYASEERVTVVGPKRSLERVSILGPARKAAQVELSKTDCMSIGLKDVPVRESGDIEGTPGVTLKTEFGELTLDKGVIVAKRHIHMTTKDAEEFGVKDKDVVSVETNCDGRKLTFGDVVVRVSDSYALAMHIDTDEANAGNIAGDVTGIVIK
ncbi:MAG: phosphate propanoyltransferase [Lachnospiraceae bacterium]|nr:phosphate propanoyltransferase [Lachnospiraceae bacterium]MBO4461785.1 phosphate propanoyltransferase [Lachnospiraceae bacterium]MBR4795519.1 phosphate propanoyltransferase [Lachnospiraceae bacterium]MBR5789212.1 phosphate propanoyltransferase [Lachnospiraceae bacterium]